MQRTRYMEARIEDLLHAKFEEPDFADCFVVAISLLPGQKLEVYVDSDGPLTLAKCQQISRYLESYLDEHGWLGETYTLEVSSPGVDRPITLPRQYAKNVGRGIELELASGEKKEGQLEEATEEGITLLEVVRRKEGKKNIKEELRPFIPFSEIKKAMIKISFKN